MIVDQYLTFCLDSISPPEIITDIESHLKNDLVLTEENRNAFLDMLSDVSYGKMIACPFPTEDESEIEVFIKVYGNPKLRK